jgi:homoserine kinase
LYNRVTLSVASSGLAVTIRGEGAEELPAGPTNLTVIAAERVFARLGRRPAGLHVLQENVIPIGSGLGSSAAAILGGMLAANAMMGSELSREALLRLAVEMEGHPDNVVPAALGGLVLVNHVGEQMHIEPIPTPPLQVVVVVPRFTLPTAQARAALPRQVPFADAVFNTGRTALLVRALAAGDYEKLAVAMQDRLHQPYRLPLVPGLNEAIAQARAAGAAGVALSGAGPGVVAFARDNHQQIAEAMQAALSAVGLESRAWVLPMEPAGAKVAGVG